MKTIFSHITRYFAMTSIAVLIIAFILCETGLRINTTDSVPKGFYWQLDKTPHKEEYVIFCPMQTHTFKLGKERGYIRAGACEGGYEYMFKRVAAMSGDTITINNEGVWINGKLWPNSKPRSTDKYNRPLTKFERSSFTLGGSEILLMGETLKSFDGRYFGSVPDIQIQGILMPLLTW